MAKYADASNANQRDLHPARIYRALTQSLQRKVRR